MKEIVVTLTFESVADSLTDVLTSVLLAIHAEADRYADQILSARAEWGARD